MWLGYVLNGSWLVETLSSFSIFLISQLVLERQIITGRQTKHRPANVRFTVPQTTDNAVYRSDL